MKRSHLTIGTCLIVVARSFAAETNVWASSGDVDDAVAGLISLIGLGSLIAGVVAFCIYFAPAFIAFRHKHPSRWVIAILNVVIAWSIIGWILLLIWATRAEHRAPVNVTVNVVANDYKNIRLEGQDNASLSTELQNLGKLRAKGVLTDSEFGKAKEKRLVS
ncbi:MAG: superinfection immunity protein [Actinobacteria bacterium]|jgi:hypothetical protein|nr:MAG: superinfection immunity protein [Actinomycetota bacterium]